MKMTFINTTTSIFSLILIFSLISCSKDQSQSGVTGVTSEKIRITGSDANTTTKTTLNGLVTSWIQTTDKVGIYSTQARTATAGGGSSVVNSQFTAASSAFSSSFTGAMYWGAANSSHTFYAYYPYATGSPAATAVPVSLPAAQTQSSANSNAHIGALDFMVATPVTVTSPANTNSVANEVNLKYNHLFTVLEFQIKGSGQLMAVKLSANSTLAFSDGTIDITQTTPATGVAYTMASQTGTSNEAVVTLTTPATLTATNTDTKVYMVINPGLQTGNCLIGLYDGATWQYISKAAPSGGFLRGKKYVVEIDNALAVSLFDQDNNVYSTVISTTGKTWLDRNLGATRVATASNDYLAYGSLYQWGRLSDGHQLINWTSSTGSDGAEQANETSTLSSGDVPSDSKFIFDPNLPSDWRSPQKDGLWQGLTGTNNPCPSGFRIPTDAELDAERASWSPQNSAGAYASPLKFTVAGNRDYQDGSLFSGGSRGYYWSSTVNGTKSNYLYFVSDDALMSDAMRALGFSVRCIKD